MVAQYPDYVIIKVQVGSYQGQDGTWNPGGVLDFRENGRFEVIGIQDAYVTGEDGRQVRVKGIIYLPKGERVFPVGASLEVIRGGESILKDTAKKFYRGQLNRRLWV